MTNTALIGASFDGPIDIVGDIHGEIDALLDLMAHLGYDHIGVHPGGRRLVFIGDLADRGPDSPSVFVFVMDLVSRGLAQCILGNHELNLLRETRKPGNGWYFDENHDIREDRFLTARALEAGDRPAIRAFLETLPLALERPDLRLVHAAWDPPSIAAVRSSRMSARELYEMYDRAGRQKARETGLAARAREEFARVGANLKNEAFAMPLLRSAGELEELEQLSNPVRIVTSGIEKAAQRPFFANEKWRMADRVPWWDDYDEPTPVIMGHYWRWPTPSARTAHSRGEPDLFMPYASHHWFGARHNVFCVDFAVGARYKERGPEPTIHYECRLGAVRWPERELVFDDGSRSPLE